MKRRLAPSQSPVISTTLRRRQNEERAASARRWGVACVLASLPLLLDLYFHFLSRLISLSSGLLWYGEVVLVVILSVSSLYDCAFSHSVATQPQIKLTPVQRKLLRVSDKKGGNYETINAPTPFGMPFPPSSSHTSSPQLSPLSLLTPSRNHPSSAYSTPHSSLSTPYTPHSSLSTPYTSHHTPQIHSNHSTPSHKSSPFSTDLISSQTALEQYLSNEAERERDLLLPLHSSSSPNELGWAGRSPHDQPSSLRKYHVATRSQSPGHLKENHSPLVSSEEDAVWAELGINREEIVRWTENCRRWLAESVVVPVAKEMESINKVLSQSSVPGLEIGAASLGTLRRECKSKGSQVPVLHLMLPYLELSAKQGYLVQRIKELAKGSCLGTYRWSGGGSWKGRTWNQDLPSDPQIVLHLLGTYMDSHLPLSTLSPDGRPFSSQHLLKFPDKPDVKKSEVVIYQSSLHPPHFKLLIGQKCIEIPKGRNNLFQCIVAFLHHLKTQKGSMLRSANLALSGINILWIVE